jgi:hypothetical protein
MTQNTADTFSKISIAISSLCIIHCLSFPLLILALPAVSHLFSDTVEAIILLSVIPLSALGFFPTWRKHKNYRFLSIYLGSLAVMLLAHFSLPHVHITHHAEAASLEFLVSTSLSVLAALSLAWVIYRNKRHTHVCANPHHHH